MRSWFTLYKKEIYKLFFFMAVVLLLVLAWELFLVYKGVLWPREIIFGLSFAPLVFFHFFFCGWGIILIDMNGRTKQFIFSFHYLDLGGN